MIDLMTKMVCFFMMLIFSMESDASQKAFVIAEKAVIYADKYMTSPIGFIAKNKKITIGDKAKFKGKVYPLIVSGRIAFIRAQDLSLERQSPQSQTLRAERFLEVTKKKNESKFILGYTATQSKVTLGENNNRGIYDGDILSFYGLAAKLEKKASSKWALQLLSNYYLTSQESEKINLVEVGIGGSYLLLDYKKLFLSLDGKILYIPYSSYSYEEDFKMNSKGMTLGLGINMDLILGESWGMEVQGGYYYTRLHEFQVPSPYENMAFTFSGIRFGVGIGYYY